MKTRKTSTPARRLLRRSVACCIALFGFWLLTLASPDGVTLQALQRLGGSPQLVTAALAAELGTPPSAELSSGSGWQKMLLSESNLLSGWDRGSSGKSNPTGEPDDEEDQQKLQVAPQGKVVERSFKASDTDGYAKIDDVYVQNKTTKQLDLPAIAALSPDIQLGPNSAPQVLIMHTHATEAYTQDGSDVYQASGTARTTDPNYNIIRVGAEIERIFNEMGLSVIHDKTLCDYPNYNGSYDRSKAVVEQYLKQYPSIKIVLDVHRDALIGQDGTVYKAVTDIDGAKTAQVLLVMGSDDGGLSHPNWQKNFSLAMRIQHRMNTLWPGLARPIALRSSRFNQQLSNGSILVEIGSHGNTLQEALSGARLFARSAGQVLLELQE